MESIPSRAIRAFDKPVHFGYAPATGSFRIHGTVNGQRVTVFGGPAALAQDESDAVSFGTSEISVPEIVDTLSSELLLGKRMRHAEPFHQMIPVVEGHGNEPIISDDELGDLILDALPTVHPFISKEAGRENLAVVSLEMRDDATDLVSTDGHRLQVVGLINVQSNFPAFEQDVEVAIPSKLLSTLKLSNCLQFDIGDRICVMTCLSKEYDMLRIEWSTRNGKFPPWHGVVPDTDNPDVSRVEQHALREWASLPRGARKDDQRLYLLSRDGDPIPAFAVLDGTALIALGQHISLEELTDTEAYTGVKAKYAWELGKLLKKVPEEDIALFFNFENGNTGPLRIDWAQGDLTYTHVLMPMRDAPGEWRRREDVIEEENV